MKTKHMASAVGMALFSVIWFVNLSGQIDCFLCGIMLAIASVFLGVLSSCALFILVIASMMGKPRV